MNRSYAFRAALAAALTSAAVAQAADPLTVFKIADEWGTIQAAGPRAGTSGVRYINAEGSNNGNFASTAPIRFYMSDVESQFDAQFGAGQWTITSVNIVLSQSNGAFTAAGGVKLYWFANDSLPITNGVDDNPPPGQFSSLGASQLRYSSGTNALDTVLADGTTDATAIFGETHLVDYYQFTSTGNTGDWPLDVLAPKNTDGTYRLVNPEDPNIQIGSPYYDIAPPILNPGSAARTDTLANFDADTQRVQTNLDITPIIQDLTSGSSALSFILVPDAATAATYKGNPFNGDYSPRIYITAEQITAPPHFPGDTNNDGVVDLVDLNNVLNNFGASGSNPGDDNSDGTVDLVDLNNVLNNFGATHAASALSVVPEPASLSLLAIGATTLLARRRRA